MPFGNHRGAQERRDRQAPAARQLNQLAANADGNVNLWNFITERCHLLENMSENFLLWTNLQISTVLTNRAAVVCLFSVVHLYSVSCLGSDETSLLLGRDWRNFFVQNSVVSVVATKVRGVAVMDQYKYRRWLSLPSVDRRTWLLTGVSCDWWTMKDRCVSDLLAWWLFCRTGDASSSERSFDLSFGEWARNHRI